MIFLQFILDIQFAFVYVESDIIKLAVSLLVFSFIHDFIFENYDEKSTNVEYLQCEKH